MTLLRNTDFAGLSVAEADVQGPILASHQRTIAQDQALNFEVLTNANADGSGSAPVTAGHDHSEAGNRLYWPVLYHSFGDHQSKRHYMEDSAYDDDTRRRNLPATIWEYLYAAPGFTDPTIITGVTCFIFPFFVPPSFAGRPYQLAFRSDANPLSFAVTLESPIGTVMDAYAVQREEANNVWSATITPPASGVWVARVTTTLSAFSNEVHEIYEMALRPLPDWPDGTMPPQPGHPPPAASGYAVHVGDDGNGWHPVDSQLAADYMPVGTIQQVNAGNDAWLQERAYGIPATGNSAITVAGHDHSGSAGFGTEVACSLGAWSFGPYPVQGSNSPYTLFKGNGFTPPIVRNTTLCGCFYGVIRTPAAANFTSSTSKLRFAAVGYESPASKSTHLAVSITTSGGGNTTTRVLTGAGTSDGYVLLTTTDGWAFNPGGFTTVAVSIKATVANGVGDTSFPVGLSGLCAYLDP